MAKPITQVTRLEELPFEARLQLVQQAVVQRIQQTPTTNPAHLRARLWVSWIKRNVLDLPTGVEVRA